MSELTREEVHGARLLLAERGITSRSDASAALWLLAYLGETLRYALLLTADIDAGPAAVRRAAAACEAWRQLPGAPVDDPHAVCVELGDPHDGNPCPRRAAVAGIPELAQSSAGPTDDQIDRVLTHLREMV